MRCGHAPIIKNARTKKMNNILVAIDLAKENERVLSRAVKIALNSNAKLHVLHVFHNMSFPDIRRDIASDPGRCKSDIRKFMEKNDHIGKIEFSIHIAHGGRVYDRVGEYARKIPADLVIVGKSDRSRDAPDFVSTTTERILVESYYPVLVVARDAGSPYKNILVRMDAPSMSETGLALVSKLGPECRVTLLAPESRFQPDSGIVSGLKRKLHDWRLRKFMREAEARLKSGGMPEGGLVYVEAANLEVETLINEARERDADVLAFKARPSRNMPHKPHALTRKLLEKTPYDILVVGRE